jgi:hypothetical protein
MNWELSLFNVALVIIFYESFHGYLYFKSKEVKREGNISVRVLDINEENAITLNSIFFRKSIVFLSNRIGKEVLTHEEGHVKQFNYIYAFLIIAAASLPISTWLVILAVPVGKFLLWRMERGADLYAYTKYNIKYESDAEVPKSRFQRLKAWVFDSHPPDHVRRKGEYYEKSNSLIKLLLNDLFS